MKVTKFGNILFFAVIFLAISSVILYTSYIVEFREMDATSIRLIQRHEDRIDQINDEIYDEIYQIVADLYYVKALIEEQGLQEETDVLGLHLELFAKSKRIYDQIRYLDGSGMEIIRVNYNDGDVFTVEGSELQDKSDRYYYQDAKSLAPGEVYISKLDLNMEMGEYEIPYKPVLRLIITMENEEGMIILNYLADHLLQEVYHLTYDLVGETYLINDEGRIINLGDITDDYSYLKEGNELFVEDLYPEVWQAKEDSVTGINSEGFYLWKQLVNTHESDQYQIVKTVIDNHLINVVESADDAFNDYDVSMSGLFWEVLRQNHALIGILFILSLVISYLRYRFNERERKINRVLQFTAQIDWKEHDDDFFTALVKYLGEEFDVRYVFVDDIEQKEDKRTIAKTLALYADGEITGNIEYDLEHTPCNNVYGKNLCIYRSEAQKRFPKDELLVSLGVESYIGIPLFSNSGESIGIIGIMDDKRLKNALLISIVLRQVAVRAAHELEHIKSQQHLEHSLNLKKSILDTTDEGIVVYNDRLEYVEWNQAITEMSTVPKDNLIGKHVLDVFPELQDNGVYDMLESCLNEGIETIEEYEYVNPEGRRYWFKDYNRPLLDSKGRQIGAIKTVTDITAYKEREAILVDLKEKADEANIVKSRFLANMSHEMRTPLNGIIGMIDLVMMDLKDKDLKSMLNVAKKSSWHLYTIINDILEYIQIENGMSELKEDYVDFRLVLKEAFESYRLSAEEKELSYTLKVDEQMPDELYMDEIKMKLILSNLISNAIKFTDYGKVLVKTEFLGEEDSQSKIRVSVQDTGIGIEKDRIASLFDSFTQADDSMTRKYGGVGLGLTISNRLVEMMGSKVIIDSRPGVGSKFIFDLELKHRHNA